MKRDKFNGFSISGIVIFLILVAGYFIPVRTGVGTSRIVVDTLLGKIILHSPFVLGIYLLISVMLIYFGIKKYSNKILILGGIIVVLLIFGGIWFKMHQNQVEPFIPVISDGDIQLGNKDAKLTLVEFTDFSCPVCAVASGSNEEYIKIVRTKDSSWEPPLPGIVENYVKTGKIKYLIKYFPGHGLGQNAQLVGWCLYEDNKELFLDYSDKVFANQEKVQDKEFLLSVVSQIGGNRATVEKCYDSGKFNSKLNDDWQYGLSEGVRGTPTFFVGSEKVEGPISYPEFAKLIDAQL